MEYTIRPLNEADVDGYRELRLEALQNHPTAFGMDYETSLHMPESHWLERIRNSDDRTTLVAEADGRFVGMTGIFRETNLKERHSGYIWGVYVRPAWRGKGLVDALVQSCLDWARERKIRLVRLGVNATNASAIRAYSRMGFSVYGVDPDVLFWEGRYHDELLMYCRLTTDTEVSPLES